MMLAFGGGMKDVAWLVAETPASSNPARPTAMAALDMCPPVVSPSPSHNNDPAGRADQVAYTSTLGTRSIARAMAFTVTSS